MLNLKNLANLNMALFLASNKTDRVLLEAG
jgi:hypothetical protein